MKVVLQQSLLSKNPQIFLMCCEMRNFSQVARALGLTQSAVSKAIQNFENELGFTLFIRNCRPLTLTAEAALLEQYLRNMTGDFAQFMSKIQNSSFIKPVLRLGIVESLATTLGVEIVKDMLPDVSQVVLHTASADLLKQRLLERKLDLVITSGLTEEKDKIHRRRLFEEPSVVLLPRTIASQCGVWSWERLARCGLPHIAYVRETGAGQVNDLFLRTHGLSFPERIAVDTNSMLVSLVREGIGWAFTRPTTVLEMIHLLDEIAVVPMQEPVLAREVFVMSREGEFANEMSLITDIAKRAFEFAVLPRILAFAPWLDGRILVED